MKYELRKKKYVDPGSRGRPKWYPVPPKDEDLLFYIQRNQNQDAIVYRLNRNLDGLVNEFLPMDAYWIKFSEGGIRRELNDLQNRLAFGYDSEKISNDLYKFHFVAYKNISFYIHNLGRRGYKAVYQRGEKTIILNNIYVYAVEFGVFPDVKYIEFFGEDLATGNPDYQKLTIE